MIYQIKRNLLIKSDVKTIWDFASNPQNLKKITPDYMNFKITSPELNSQIYEGMIIEYTVSPMMKIPLTWVTEITHVHEHKSFIDEQRFGPYRMWHHEHILKREKKGVVMEDIVTYVPPFGIIGKFVNSIYLKKKLHQIFDYREKKMNQIFS